jgi:hypothetical protein
MVSNTPNDNYLMQPYKENTAQIELQIQDQAETQVIILSHKQITSLDMVDGVSSKDLCVALKDGTPISQPFTLQLPAGSPVTIVGEFVQVFTGTKGEFFRLIGEKTSGDTTLIFTTLNDGGYYALLTIQLGLHFSNR